jgi:hypothetical protein
MRRALIRRFKRAWGLPAPPERLATLRILVGGFALAYLLLRGRHIAAYGDFPDSQFDPVGVLRLLSGPLSATTVDVVVVATIVAGVAFTAGFRYRMSGPAFALLLLFVTTYRNSWGQVFHTENILVLHVLVLAFAPAADALSVDARGGPARASARADYGTPIFVMCLLTVLTYMVSGQTKLRGAGLDWLTSDTLRNYIAYDNLRKAELGDPYSALGAALVGQGWLFKPLAVFTLAVELGAIFAMLGGRVARLWVAAAWIFHAGVLAFMAILFPYPLLGIAFAPFFQVERLLAPLHALRLRLAPARPHSVGQH